MYLRGLLLVGKLSSDNGRGEKSLLVEDCGRIRCNNVNGHKRPYTRKS